MADPDWARILEYLHEHNGEFLCEAGEDEFEEEDKPSHAEHEAAFINELRGKVALQNPSEEAIVESHKHLQNTGLVQYVHNADTVGLKLLPDGFTVAHERELSNRQDKINSALVIFTLFLILVNIVGNSSDPHFRFYGNLTLLLLLAVLLKWTDLLDLPGL